MQSTGSITCEPVRLVTWRFLEMAAARSDNTNRPFSGRSEGGLSQAVVYPEHNHRPKSHIFNISAPVRGQTQNQIAFWTLRSCHGPPEEAVGRGGDRLTH
jgi:hypothetical protein